MLLSNKKIKNKFKTKIKIPHTIAISTNEFDHFMDKNKLWDIALHKSSNEDILKKFLKSKLQKDLKKKLNNAML